MKHEREDRIQVESASHVGPAYPCSCGDCFENREELDNHIEAMKPYAIRFEKKLDYLLHWYFWIWGVVSGAKFAWWTAKDLWHWIVK